MKQVWLALGLGCLVCCLPLVVPFFGAAGLAAGSGWAIGLPWMEIACMAAGAAAAALAVLTVVRWRRQTSGPYCDPRK